MKKNILYTELAELFKYPDLDFKERVHSIQDRLSLFNPDAAAELKRFTNYVDSCTQDQLEELFTKTFDVQPICYLDLGYVIFGEDYKRGVFLTHMQEEQKKINVDSSPELPDNLYHVLRLLDKHPDSFFVEELVVNIILPGVEKMIHEFSSARVDLKLKVIKKLHKAIIQEELNVGNVYEAALKALLFVLKNDFSEATQKYQLASIPDSSKSFFKKENTINQSVNELVSNYKID